MQENKTGLTVDEDDKLQDAFIQAVRIEIRKKKIKGSPIAKYDARSKKAYIQYSDGRKVYFDGTE